MSERTVPTPDDQNFDWMNAFLKCSAACEFVELKHAAKAASETYRAAWEKHKPKATIEFGFNAASDNSSFNAYRKDKEFESGTSVKFSRANDHILVEHDNKASYKITLTLNDQGECRYQIDGAGEYHRWQVLKKMLLGIVYLRVPG